MSKVAPDFVVQPCDDESIRTAVRCQWGDEALGPEGLLDEGEEYLITDMFKGLGIPEELLNGNDKDQDVPGPAGPA